MRYPKKLEIGKYIGTTAPSSGITNPVNLERLNNVKYNLEMLGYQFKETPNVRTDEKGRSSTPRERAEQFMSLWEDDNVDAIISAGGGDFLNEMLDKLKWERLKELEPKWFQGYSDNTGLTFLITTILDTASIHGPTVKDFGMRKLHKSLTNSLELMKNKEIIQESYEKCESNIWTERTDPYEEYNLQNDVEWKNLKGEEKINFTGRSIGGSFDVIMNLIGTKYDKVKEYIEKYKEDGIVWFLEIFEMTTPQIFNNLWQMKNAGYFENCNGIIFGRPLIIREEYEINYEDILKQFFKNMNIPVIYNADIGHVSPQISIVSGAIIEVESENGKGFIKNYLR